MRMSEGRWERECSAHDNNHCARDPMMPITLAAIVALVLYVVGLAAKTRSASCRQKKVANEH